MTCRTCAHRKLAHIYGEGACRPGYRCKNDCTTYIECHGDPTGYCSEGVWYADRDGGMPSGPCLYCQPYVDHDRLLADAEGLLRLLDYGVTADVLRQVRKDYKLRTTMLADDPKHKPVTVSRPHESRESDT